jgi:hypothetical protein
MKLFLGVLADGAVNVLGRLEPPDHGRINVVSPKGHPLCGLAYEDAIQYAWIETDDAGSFVTGEKLPPPGPIEIPPFLRRQP